MSLSGVLGLNQTCRTEGQTFQYDSFANRSRNGEHDASLSGNERAKSYEPLAEKRKNSYVLQLISVPGLFWVLSV